MYLQASRAAMPLKPWQPCLLANTHVGSPQQPMSLVCAMNFIGVYKVVGVELCHVAVKFIPLPVGLNKPLHSLCVVCCPSQHAVSNPIGLLMIVTTFTSSYMYMISVDSESLLRAALIELH